MRILIDLDDTLVNMMEKAVYYFNSIYAPDDPVTLDGLTDWALPDIEKWRALWKIPGFFADLPFMDPDAQSVLRALKNKGHEIVIVSAVPTWASCADKYQWCHTHLRIPGIIDSMDQVILTRGKHYIEGEIMIDDKPSNLEDRRYPILFRRPWNRKTECFRKAGNWDEVWARVLDIECMRSRSSRHLGGCV